LLAGTRNGHLEENRDTDEQGEGPLFPPSKIHCEGNLQPPQTHPVRHVLAGENTTEEMIRYQEEVGSRR
jgi:hypothetical protein